jgi:2-methylcitrate dehydratase
LTPASFGHERLWSAELRALLPKIEVVSNEEFTEAYERVPVEHRTRVTVSLKNGQRQTGYAGGAAGDLSQPKSDADIEQKFRALSEGRLDKQRIDLALSTLWDLETLADVCEIPRLMAFDR